MSTLLPKHVAVIMDGNGRWAQKRHLPRAMGHKAGVKTARMVVEISAKQGIDVLTLFAFGQENWTRPADEVDSLMSLFIHSLRTELPSLDENNIRVVFIGDVKRFPSELQASIAHSQRQTSRNTGLTLVLAVNYSGRWDILQATQRLIEDVASGAIDPGHFDETLLTQYLSTAKFPEPDLLIRTSGECRISNFMLWQLAYTEMVFTKTLWPDFSAQDYELALHEYSGRHRRFGSTSQPQEEMTC